MNYWESSWYGSNGKACLVQASSRLSQHSVLCNVSDFIFFPRMGILKQLIWSVLPQILFEIFQYTVILSIFQLALQGVLSLIKAHYLPSQPLIQENPDGESKENRGPLNIPYLRGGGEFLGLTGDNSPKKRIIEHLVWKSFTLPFLAFIAYFLWKGFNFWASLVFFEKCLVCSLF